MRPQDFVERITNQYLIDIKVVSIVAKTLIGRELLLCLFSPSLVDKSL